MKARWKWTIAVVAIGIAYFLAAIIITHPARHVQIRFLGYETNGTADIAARVLFNTSVTYARFSLTNGSDRTMVCSAVGGVPWCGAKIKNASGWHDIPRKVFLERTNLLSVSLQPGQTSSFSVPASDLNQPLRVTVAYKILPKSKIGRGQSLSTSKLASARFFTKFQNRVSSFFRWKLDQGTASITIQD